MSKLSRLSVPLLAVLALAGCGAQAHQTPTRPAPAPVAPGQQFCSGLTDTCQPVVTHRGQATGSAQGRIPDVSSYQNHPDWPAAKAAGIAGAIFKGGEYGIDPDAAYNNAALRSLHLWRAMYWLIRNTGCSHEVGQIIALARSFGVIVVINDIEEPEAAGYGACLVSAEKAAHLIPVDYTSPGTWPGGAGFAGAPLWQAEYGPTLNPFWHPLVAWQCTDGHFGCVTFVPGIGDDDVSINLGITKLGASAPAPVVRCYRKGWPVPTSARALCNKVRAHDSFLGVVVKHEDGYLAVTNRNIAVLSAQIAKLKAQRSSDLGRHTTELHARNGAAGLLAADLHKYGFTG